MTTKYSHGFHRIFNFTRNFSRLCGADMVVENYRMCAATWSILVLVNCAIIFTFYSMYVAVVINGDWTEFLKLLCMFGTGVQGYVKLVNGIRRPGLVRFIYLEITGIYSEFEQKHTKFHKLLQTSVTLVRNIMIILLAVVLLVIFAIIGTPALYKIIYKERIFIMPFYFPYIDFETDFGYYLTSLFHVICVVFGIFGNFVNDSWCFVFAAHIPLIKNILQAKFKELDEILQNEEREPSADANVKLLDILQWHQKYLVYCDCINDFFFWVIFVQVATEFVSIVCTIVSIFLGNWPAAPVYLVYSFVLFYLHCGLGNLIDVSNDDVVLMIYDCNWYNLNVPQQKMILIMLRRAQKSEGMSIGGIAPLSMNTALQLTKTFYTFSMMLRQFLN